MNISSFKKVGTANKAKAAPRQAVRHQHGPLVKRSDAPAIIRVDNLTMGWDEVVLQQDLSFEVKRGEVFSILGGSGCGKSTLLRYLVGLEAIAKGGSITVEGKKGQEVVDALKAAGIGAARTYPETMDIQPPAKAAGTIMHGDLARSKAFCERVVNLPLFYGMREEEREAAVAALLAIS